MYVISLNLTVIIKVRIILTCFVDEETGTQVTVTLCNSQIGLVMLL